MTNRIIKDTWFKDWFDSPYYHVLYQHRDEKEAKLFIEKLASHLGLKPTQKVLDLACGKGRHAYFLSELNLDVYGADLASNSIQEAKKMESENLHFFVHDMRNTLPIVNFDYIFNLFTSFGYFEEEAENGKVLHAIYDALKPGGKLIIDFMNVTKVMTNLVKEEAKTCSTTPFLINRWEDGKHIFKKISFNADGVEKTFVEKVQILHLSDFENLLTNAGFILENTFGNYLLEPFNISNSDRLILIASKK